MYHLVLATSATFALVHQPIFAAMPMQMRPRGPSMTARNDGAPTDELPAVPATPATTTSSSETLLVGAVAPTKQQQSNALVAILPVLTAGPALAVLVTWLLAQWTGPVAGGVKLIYAGAVAGIISRTCCAPLEMVSTLMMCRGDECSSMTEELRRAWRTEGIGGLFKGNTANCLKVAPSRGVQFLVYEFAKRQLRTLGWGVASGGALNAGARLCAGGIAGMVAAVIVYPLEVVKTIRTVYPDECTSIRDAFRVVIKYGGGVTALYAGIMPTLIAMFPYVGVEFMVYETLKRRWEVLAGGALGTAALLAVGGLAGAAAQASAHPLDVVRRRMQMEGLRGRFGKKQDANGKPQTPARPPVKNLASGLYRIGREEGWHVLFKGLGPACFEKVPSTAIGYIIYEAMKRTLGLASV